MKRILALACAASLLFAGAAGAQPYDRGPPGQGPGYQGPGPQGPGPQGPGPQGPGRHFAPENESENNSLSFLLTRGYQVVAGWDGTLVLQRAERVYLCPYTRYRTGGGPSAGQATSGMCQHIREGIQY